MRDLIRLACKNPSWGAPKIHGEILKLGFEVAERTVARYVRRVHRRGDPNHSWRTFLDNHREAIVAIDLFTVPTTTFRLLHCLFVIEHGHRKILHFNVTAHATTELILQQLLETFAESGPYRYMFGDYDSKFNTDVISFLECNGTLSGEI